jgi:hypothetical protein
MKIVGLRLRCSDGDRLLVRSLDGNGMVLILEDTVADALRLFNALQTVDSLLV